MTSCNCSLTNFNGFTGKEGPVFCLNVRGEPVELLGDSGGALPAGNMEGKELLPLFVALSDVPSTLVGLPDFASSIKRLTCTHELK
uniref:Calcium ion binding protein n=1 Tax=Rhizophora mucronata TaxID=61149 RepID=A0A2P2LTU9_RHIMU